MTVVWNPKGQMCNQLYHSLYTHILGSTGKDNVVKYKCPRDIVYSQFLRLGLGDISIRDSDVSKDDVLVHTGHRQGFGVDFSKDDLRSYISRYIVGSYLADVARSMATFVDYDRSVAVHIRNTDYVGRFADTYVCFDRRDYISSAISMLDLSIVRRIYVFSDDIVAARILVESALLSCRPGIPITYVKSGPADYDLMRLAMFRNKIIINSTFSTWAGFIGNVIYPGSESSVIAPDVTWRGRMNKYIYDPAWSFVSVKRT